MAAELEVERFRVEMKLALAGYKDRIRVGDQALRFEYTVVRLQTGDDAADARLLLVLGEHQTQRPQVDSGQFRQ